MKNDIIMVILRSFGKGISTAFFSKGSQKSNKTTTILQFFFVLEGKYLFWHHMSKFPDLSGFWEFPKDSKVVPIYVLNSQELGKFPESSNTGKLTCLHTKLRNYSSSFLSTSKYAETRLCRTYFCV